MTMSPCRALRCAHGVVVASPRFEQNCLARESMTADLRVIRRAAWSAPSRVNRELSLVGEISRNEFDTTAPETLKQPKEQQ
jgi:hypothetical protein